MWASQFGNLDINISEIPSWNIHNYTCLSVLKSEFQGHKMLLMLILLMIGKRRWRKKTTYWPAHRTFVPYTLKRPWPPWPIQKLSDLLQVFYWGQCEVSCLFQHPSNQVFHLESRVKQAPLQVFDRGHIKFLVGLQCSTPGTVRFSLELA